MCPRERVCPPEYPRRLPDQPFLSDRGAGGPIPPTLSFGKLFLKNYFIVQAVKSIPPGLGWSRPTARKFSQPVRTRIWRKQMRKPLLLPALTAILFAVLAVVPARADEYAVDAVHSGVNFKISHL